WNGSPRRGGTPWSCPHTPPTCRPRASTPSACCSPRRPTMTTDLAGRGTGAGPGSGAGTGSGPGTGPGTTTGTATGTVTGTGTAPGTVTGAGTAPAAGSGRGRPPADRPRDAACQRFAGELRRALADVPPAAADRPLPEVAVRALGVEDAFGAPAGQPSDGRAAPAGAVPVHLYGHHVIVGPWPDGDRPGCGTCLRRRWQSVRSVGLREGLELRGGTREAGPWPHLVPFAAQAVAALIASRAGAPARDAGRPFPDVWLVDVQRLTVRHHPLVPEPDCPECAGPEPVTAEGAALVLR